MITHRKAALLLAVGVIALGACLYLAHHGRHAAEPVATLRLGIQDNPVCALPLIAAEKQFFRKYGLDVEIHRYPSGKLALNAMFDGKVDIAATADMPVMVNSFKRDDFAVFGQIAWTEHGAWIVARRDRGIDKPANLRGKRVATQQNSAVHFFLSAFLLKHGINEQDIDLVFMKAVELPAALAEGTIDAFSMRNPFIAQAKLLLGDNAIEMFSAVYRQSFNVVTWTTVLKEQRRAIECFLHALAEAEDLVLRDPQAAMAATIAQFGLPRAAEVQTDWHRYTFDLAMTQGLLLTLENEAQWAIRRNPQLGNQIPNYLRFIDIGPMRAVKPESVSIID